MEIKKITCNRFGDYARVARHRRCLPMCTAHNAPPEHCFAHLGFCVRDWNADSRAAAAVRFF